MAAAEDPDFGSLLAKASTLVVRDNEGQETMVQDLYKEKKTILVFVRVSENQCGEMNFEVFERLGSG